MRQALFVKNRQMALQLADETNVIFFPVDNSGWNDFSHNFAAGFMSKSTQGVAIEERALLMFEGGGYSSSRMQRDILKGADYLSGEDAKIVFISMFSDSHIYRRIIDKVGLSEALNMMKAAHDAVVLAREGASEEDLALLGKQEFWYGALRRNEAYNAFRRAHQYFIPRSNQHVADSAISFSFKADLHPANNAFEVYFDFSPDSLERNRISVIIGENGSGKTQLLLALIDQIASGSSNTDAPPSCNKVIAFSSIASDAYPRSLSLTAQIDYQYFSLVSVTNDGGDPTIAAIIDCLRDDHRIDFVFGDNQFIDRYSLLVHLLSSIGLQRDIYVPLEEGGEEISSDEKKWEGVRYYPLTRGLNEQRQLQLYKQINYKGRPTFWGIGEHPRQLSSGESAIFRFMSQIVGNIEVGSMLLLDEPETHLHPRYISLMMDVLASILESTKSVAIIATHSAYIVREVPQQRVSIFSISKRNIDVLRPRLQTFGSNIDSISKFVFGDPALGHHYQTTLREWADGLPPELTVDEIVAQFGSKMNQETLSYVAQYIAEGKN